MVEREVKINGIEDAKKMVSVAMKCGFNVELISGTITVDAKSIMGIFSLDFGAKTLLRLACDEKNEALKMFDSFVIA